MNELSPKSGSDELDNNARILSQAASVPDIIASADVHTVQVVDDAHYDMRHEQRGVAAIFNHKKFFHQPTRNASDVDCDNMRQVLSDLQFEVRVHEDLLVQELMQVLSDLADENHKSSDCLLVVIMTHGEHDMLCAKDRTFSVNRLWENFVGDACPTLLGKPKLFFIQACRGDKVDTGVHLDHLVQSIQQVTRTGAAVAAVKELPQRIMPLVKGKSIQYAIPSMADLLVMYSTYKGHYSWRHSSQGSWFIHALCDELRTHGNSHELWQLLTAVSRKVAFECQSNSDELKMSVKQMPCIVSMLTKLVYFPRK